MRTIRRFLLVIGMLCAAAVHAQDTNAPRTFLDQFEAVPDQVIVKGSSDVGSVVAGQGSLFIRCKESVDISTGTKAYGLAITMISSDQHSDTTIIDYDELDSLIRGLDYLSGVNWSATSLENFSAVFTTRDGFRVAAYSSQKRTGTIGISFQSSRTTAVRIAAAQEQLSQLRNLVQQAKTMLDTLRAAK